MRKLKNEELKRLTPEEFRNADKIPVVIVLDNIRSLNNIGSVFRTADAFRVAGIYLCGISTTPPHKDIQKTALGATESVYWKYFNKTSEAINSLRESGYKIISIEQADKAVMLQEFEISHNQKIAFIFGHEVKGVDQEVVNLSDDCIEIPQFGTKHSFNISVSAGIVLWDYFLKTSNR
ncbi:MAG: RNA methyltransferase [Bacteroidales bacterium]|nr:RNA methyltransferase [Bacteroidales bacterium]MCF8387312.1 RNA methyltransferase [Bacteroidales bacterium]MCF8397966.1 RNA methyltransferase [Bacteroidales bacterium]